MLQQLAKNNYHAIVMEIDIKSVEQLIDNELSKGPEWPRVLVTMSSGNLAVLIKQFDRRVIGFTTIVPNPELPKGQLSRSLQKDSEKYSSGLALTYEGMEAYVGARLLVDALRRTPKNLAPATLFDVLDGTPRWDIDGFELNFSKDRPGASDWVDIGLRSRFGTLIN
jgi:hypothetical protein